MGKKHNLDEVVRSLANKRDVRVDTKLNVVEILHPAQYQDLGNGSWGKIDYLVNHCRFTKLFVSEFSVK